MAQSDTVERILDAAAALFAERGFAETSLRTITSTAGVNLAAVNYHFGSKKALIQAVFGRYLQPFCEVLEQNLDAHIAANNGVDPDVDQLLQCLFTAMLEASARVGEQPQRFMRLLGLAYNQSQEHLRRFIVAEFGAYYSRFTGLLKAALPHLDPVAFYWRLYFMLGATVFTLSSFDSIRAILNSEFDRDTSLDQAVGLLVPAISGMLSVDNSTTTH
ncbi:TetR/AcrR family transcriptional regulator [Exilibacterium tricleocarpae]|uniref:TetR/AcrR family transcriptional regulator n=1 Tax=Exilibacterium tricleocarpae TaxID=2591008 RepID=A0A545TVV3_9GAMM|nr:TetR/AcrR family transcriptional regulator [Exilibacterium tricleocarpae]TQV81358.1 TetR/AcrR family transcriptional regulator [Exilibacterium tricleocarpae]